MGFKSYMSMWKKSSYYFKIIFVLMIIFIIHQLLFSKKESFKDGNSKPTFEVKNNHNIYDSLYANMYDSLFHDPIKIKHEMTEIIRLTDLNNTSIVLDIGSGTGDHLGYLKKSIKCVGMDDSKDMLQVAKKKYPHVKFQQANALDTMSFMEGQFSHILMMYFTIYYIEDKYTLFKNIYRWLKPGGFVAIHLVNKYKFDPIVNASNPLIMLSPQKYAKKRITTSEIKFNDYQYKADFKLNGDKATFEETIKQDDTKNVRKHIHQLHMESQKNILELATNIGLEMVGKIDLVTCQYEYQYIYILKKPS